MSPTEEVKAVSDAIEIASKYGLVTEVVWSALQATDGTIEEKINFGLNEWIK